MDLIPNPVLGIQFDLDTADADFILQEMRQWHINPLVPTEYQNVGRPLTVFINTIKKLLECVEQLQTVPSEHRWFEQRVVLVKLIYSYISTDINILLQYPRLFTAVREKIQVLSDESSELLPYLHFFCSHATKKHDRDIT